MLPILIGGAILSALAGGVMAVDGISKLEEAEDIVKNAEKRYNAKKEETEKKQKELEDTLARLGNLKYSILKKDFKRFISFAERVKRKVKIKETFVDDIVKLSTDIEIKTAKIEEFIEKAVLERVPTSVAAGVLSLYGALAIGEAVGVASTGTAISSLSGAAFTNALLAWFGGGAIAAGGGGIALGTAVLGGLALAPAILVGGAVLSSKGEEALTEAKEYEYEVEKTIGEMEVQIKKANCLIKKAEEKEKVLTQLRKMFNEFMDIYEGVDEITETDLLSIYALAKNMKHLIDLPLVDKDKETVC